VSVDSTLGVKMHLSMLDGLRLRSPAVPEFGSALEVCPAQRDPDGPYEGF